MKGSLITIRCAQHWNDARLWSRGSAFRVAVAPDAYPVAN